MKLMEGIRAEVTELQDGPWQPDWDLTIWTLSF